MFKKVIIVGDDFGIPLLLDIIPKNKIIAVVLASIRPKNHIYIKQIVGAGIPIITQPSYFSDKYPGFLREINQLEPDCIFCNSYSMLIRTEILQLVGGNAFNVHASFLPRNRGPNPIQWSIIKGEDYTGVSIHCMDADFDTGKIVNQLKVKIDFEDTWVSLRDKLTKLTIQICRDTIPELLKGNYSTKNQDEKMASRNFRLTEYYPKIDFNLMSNIEIYNLIRAQIKPLKGAYIIVREKKYYFDALLPLNAIAQLRRKYAHSNILQLSHE